MFIFPIYAAVAEMLLLWGSTTADLLYYTLYTV